MRFEVTQHYASPVDAVLALYTEPDFVTSLGELPRIGRPEVLEHRPEPGRLTTRIRFRFTADLPSAATAVIDRDRLTWIEETVYDLGARRAAVRLLPDHYPDRLTASAAVAFTDDGRGGSVRQVRGELKVRMPLVAGKVERAIVDGLEEYLDAEQVVVCKRLGGC